MENPQIGRHVKKMFENGLGKGEYGYLGKIELTVEVNVAAPEMTSTLALGMCPDLLDAVDYCESKLHASFARRVSVLI